MLREYQAGQILRNLYLGILYSNYRESKTKGKKKILERSQGAGVHLT